MSCKNIFYYFFVFSFIIVLFSCSPQADKYVDPNPPDIPENLNENDHLDERKEENPDDQQSTNNGNNGNNGGDGGDGNDGNTQERDPSLLITEVTKDWIEIYNVQPLGSPPISLSEYKIRASSSFNGKVANAYYNFPAYNIEPQSYIVVRFHGHAPNDYSDIMTIRGPGLKQQGFRYEGFYEIALEGKSIDYVGFCSDSSGNLPVPPLTGSFSNCVDYYASSYLSFARSKDLSDSDSGDDWVGYSVPTFGGPNDVTDITDDDQDGIPDANEQVGTTFAGMPLYDWGARVNQRDIFVHIDYMDAPAKKGLIPPKASLDKIKRVFSENGFAIHFDVGNLHSSTVSPENHNLSGQSHAVPYAAYITIYEIAEVSPEVPDLVSSAYYKSRYMPVSRFGIFHYSLFANKHATSGKVDKNIRGIAERPGNDSVILLGGNERYNNYGKEHRENISAAVLFHELGHNFDLRHGGNDDINFKPNHFSTMNYGYAYVGVPEYNGIFGNFLYRYLSSFQDVSAYNGNSTSSGNHIHNLTHTSFKINYSHGRLPPLDENAITDSFRMPGRTIRIDWNYNLKEDKKPYVFNLNPKNKADTKQPVYEVLQDYDEWGNLKLPFDYGKYYYDYFSLSSTPKTPSRFQHLSKELAPNTVSCEFHEHRVFE